MSSSTAPARGRPAVVITADVDDSPGERPRRGPGSRADDAHPTRRQLLTAARLLLDDPGQDDPSVSEITRLAGVAKGTFYVHFSDRDAFLLALHEDFHDQLFQAIDDACASLAPGPERLWTRLVAFLDGCRHTPGVRHLLWSASRQPGLRREVQRRDAQAAAAIAEDLRATGGNPRAFETARLLVAAATAVTVAELDAGRRLPRMRAALKDLTSRADRSAGAG